MKKLYSGQVLRVPVYDLKPRNVTLNFDGHVCFVVSGEKGVGAAFEKAGYPLTKELCFQVKRTLDIDGRKSPFPNNLLGRGWFDAFNPFTHVDASDGLTNYKNICRKRFRNMKSWSATLAALSMPMGGVPICVKSNKVLAPTGAKHVYQVLPGDKTQITVMACFNAAGDYMPPLIVYPGQRFRDDILSGFQEAIYGHSLNGSMDSELFTEFTRQFNDYVTRQFNDYVTRKGIQENR